MQKDSRARAHTVAHAAAIEQDHFSQEELDACKKELAEERERSLELQERVGDLQKQLETLSNEVMINFVVNNHGAFYFYVIKNN